MNSEPTINMAEEFQESEVIFSDYYNNDKGKNDDDDNCLSYQEMILSNNSSGRGRGRVARGGSKKKKAINKKNKSVPVNINMPADNTFQYVDKDYESEEEYDDGELVPPHVIIGRRIAGKMAFSVCTGYGRTLKGRDLSQVRNSILRMTGFLET